MSLWAVLVCAIVAGFGLWILNQPWVPLDDRVKKVVSAFVLLLLVLAFFYVVLGLLGVALPRVRDPFGAVQMSARVRAA